MLKNTHTGSVFVFLGAVFWSLNAPLVKYLTVDPLLVCGLRSLIAGIVLLPFLRLKRLNWTPWMLLYLVSYCALCISIIIALSKTSAAIAIGMQYTAAIWLFISSCLASRRFNKKTFIPVALISIGVLFFMGSGKTPANITGNLIALSEGVFFACMSAGAKKSAGDNPLGLAALANLFTGLLVFAAFPATISLIPSLSVKTWHVLLILGVVQIGAGYSFYNVGIQKITAQKASILALWEMILGPVWVALFLKEYPAPLVLAGFSVILLGMLLEAKPKVIKKEPWGSSS